MNGFSDLSSFNNIVDDNGDTLGVASNPMVVEVSGAIEYGTDNSSNKYRIETEDNNIYLSDSYQSIFSVSNYHGALLGIRIAISTKYASFKLTIDSNQVFEIPVNNLDKLLRHNGNGNNDIGLGYDNNIFYFYPVVPINYTTSILFEAKKTSGGTKYISEQLYHIIKVAN